MKTTKKKNKTKIGTRKRGGPKSKSLRRAQAHPNIRGKSKSHPLIGKRRSGIKSPRRGGSKLKNKTGNARDVSRSPRRGDTSKHSKNVETKTDRNTERLPHIVHQSDPKSQLSGRIAHRVGLGLGIDSNVGVGPMKNFGGANSFGQVNGPLGAATSGFPKMGGLVGGFPQVLYTAPILPNIELGYNSSNRALLTQTPAAVKDLRNILAGLESQNAEIARLNEKLTKVELGTQAEQQDGEIMPSTKL
jgi:hypothetical protein